ncbi:MAG: hypothetical protein ACLPX5_13015 [Dissulfurispiraceae bacterium]
MKSKFLSTSILVFLMFIYFSGCHKTAPPLILKDFGPTKTRAGEGFNIQPNGSSAMWVKADNVTETTVIVWGENHLRSFKEPYGISTLIPKELYAKPGKYQIYLLDTETGAKSNSVFFNVE